MRNSATSSGSGTGWVGGPPLAPCWPGDSIPLTAGSLPPGSGGGVKFGSPGNQFDLSPPSHDGVSDAGPRTSSLFGSGRGGGGLPGAGAGVSAGVSATVTVDGTVIGGGVIDPSATIPEPPPPPPQAVSVAIANALIERHRVLRIFPSRVGDVSGGGRACPRTSGTKTTNVLL